MKRALLATALSATFFVSASSVAQQNAEKPATGAVPQYRLPAELFQVQPRPMAAMPRKAALPNEGTVVSSTDSGGYSYVEVTGAQGNVWLAAPTTKLSPGDKIRYEDGAVMRNFTSRALNRTFPAIIFVGNVAPANGAVPTAAATPHGGADPHAGTGLHGSGGMPHAGMPQGGEAAAMGEGTVVSSQSSGGYSYIEVTGSKGNVWLAAPMTQVKVGEKIRYETGSEMRNFTSRALNRTFPSIFFVGSVAVVSAN